MNGELLAEEETRPKGDYTHSSKGFFGELSLLAVNETLYLGVFWGFFS